MEGGHWKGGGRSGFVPRKVQEHDKKLPVDTRAVHLAAKQWPGDALRGHKKFRKNKKITLGCTQRWA